MDSSLSFFFYPSFIFHLSFRLNIYACIWPNTHNIFVYMYWVFLIFWFWNGFLCIIILPMLLALRWFQSNSTNNNGGCRGELYREQSNNIPFIFTQTSIDASSWTLSPFVEVHDYCGRFSSPFFLVIVVVVLLFLFVF